jgi:microcompartment protein CcmL/EutN
MKKTNTSKKALRSLINDSMQEVLSNLELPTPSKKVKKLLQRNAKKIASVYANILKREDKKKKKAEKFAEDKVKSKSKKTKQVKASKKQELETA